YDDRKEAGTAIIGICKEMKQANVAVPIGDYMGMKMSGIFDSFTKSFSLNVKGNLSHSIELGSDPSGNITRISNALEGMSRQLEEAIQKLSNVEQQLETAKIEVVKPFAQEQELNDKLARLAELNSLLDMDDKGEDKVDMDEDAPKPVPEKETAKQLTSESERPSLIARLNEKKEIVASRVQTAPDVQKKKTQEIA
ncbi:MAG: helicase, partial [Lachnospiraceae bacterium]|nr:helicase [Lachnospiraceae bacterium]